MTPKLARKPDKPDPEKTYIALEPIAGETRTVKQGERLPGSDPFVIGNFRSFYDAETPVGQRPNFWHLVDDPPEPEPHVNIPPSIPPHRQVKSVVDVWWDGGHAPGSPGAASGRPSGFGTALRRGQVVDVFDPVVRQNPSWFRWVEREVSPDDIGRLERWERLEAGDAAA
jgi:hypothetical protein